MSVLYKIRDWSENFETSESKKRIKSLSWVAMPTKHDGKVFRRLMQIDPSGAIFGAWCLIVQVAAKCPTRGMLADDDGPLSPEDISLKTGLSKISVASALELFSGPEIRWVEKIFVGSNSEEQNNTEHDTTLQSAGAPAASAAIPADLHNINGAQLVTTNKTETVNPAAVPAASAGAPADLFRLFPSGPDDNCKKWISIFPPRGMVGRNKIPPLYEAAIWEIQRERGCNPSDAIQFLNSRTSEYSKSWKGIHQSWNADKWLSDGHWNDPPESWADRSFTNVQNQKPKVQPLSKVSS